MMDQMFDNKNIIGKLLSSSWLHVDFFILALNIACRELLGTKGTVILLNGNSGSFYLVTPSGGESNNDFYRYSSFFLANRTVDDHKTYCYDLSWLLLIAIIILSTAFSCPLSHTKNLFCIYLRDLLYIL